MKNNKNSSLPFSKSGAVPAFRKLTVTWRSQEGYPTIDNTIVLICNKGQDNNCLGQKKDTNPYKNQGEASRRMVLTPQVSVIPRPGDPSNEHSVLSASSQAYGGKEASIRHVGKQRMSSCNLETTHVFLKQPQGTASLVSALTFSAASNQILHHRVGASHTLSKILLSGEIKKTEKHFALYLESVLLGLWRTESKINKKVSEESNEKLKTAPCLGPCVLF